MARNWIEWLTIGLMIEKIIQHILSAVFFIVFIEGIGTPDIGTRFIIDNQTMAMLNMIYALLFLVALIFLPQKPKFRTSGLYFTIIMNAVDIISEILFHGMGYITVSVIVSTIIIILSFSWKKNLQIYVENE